MPYYQIKFRRDLGFLKKHRSDMDVEADDALESLSLGYGQVI